MKTFDAMKFLVVAYTLGLFAIVAIVLVFGVRSDSKELAIALATAVSGSAGLIVGWYFGSSQGSQRKTDLLTPKKEGE